MSPTAYDMAEWFNRPLAEFTSIWSGIFCKNHHERRVARSLSDAGFGVYLPMLERIQRDAAGKRRRIRVPRFEPYVFVNAPDFSRAEMAERCPKASSSALSIIPVVNQGRIDRELRAFEIAEQNGLLVGDVIGNLSVGQPVKVIAPHPLMGHQGVIIHVQRQKKFVLQLTDFGCASEVEIDPQFLEADEEAAA
jgi:transcription antitermination factor NusG